MNYSIMLIYNAAVLQKRIVVRKVGVSASKSIGCGSMNGVVYDVTVKNRHMFSLLGI